MCPQEPYIDIGRNSGIIQAAYQALPSRLCIKDSGDVSQPQQNFPPTIIEMSNLFYYEPFYLDRLVDGIPSGRGIPTNATAQIQKGIAMKPLKPM